MAGGRANHALRRTGLVRRLRRGVRTQCAAHAVPAAGRLQRDPAVRHGAEQLRAVRVGGGAGGCAEVAEGAEDVAGGAAGAAGRRRGLQCDEILRAGVDRGVGFAGGGQGVCAFWAEASFGVEKNVGRRPDIRPDMVLREATVPASMERRAATSATASAGGMADAAGELGCFRPFIGSLPYYLQKHRTHPGWILPWAI